MADSGKNSCSLLINRRYQSCTRPSLCSDFEIIASNELGSHQGHMIT